MRVLLAAPLVLASFLGAATARAEPASWLTLGTGYVRDRTVSYYNGANDALVIQGEIGIGTSLVNPVVIGAFAAIRFDLGLDDELKLGARLASRSYMVGDWGWAVDLGVASHLLKPSIFGHFPIEPAVNLGIPWGPVLQVGASFADATGQSPAALGGFVVISIDFVRLAAARAHGTASFFPDPPPPPDDGREHILLQ